jgi:hypothetical protein
MNIERTERQESTNPPLLIADVSTKTTSQNDFIITCLKELGFKNYLGEKKIYVRYDAGWGHLTKIELLENQNGNYTRFNLESDYNGSTKIIGGRVPYNKMGVKSIFDIAGVPLAFESLKGLGYGRWV